MMLTESQIQGVIAEVVRAELAPCDVRVSVVPDDRSDDESIYVVTVSIEADDLPEKRKMLSLTRIIRDRLSKSEIYEIMPMLSFISRRDEQQSGLVFA